MILPAFLGPGKFVQNELLTWEQFPAVWVKLCFETNKQMWNILLFSCLPHTKACTFILRTSLVCWPDPGLTDNRHICMVPFSHPVLCLTEHARLLSFCWSQCWLVQYMVKSGEHCQCMVNKTADFEHCYLCHDSVLWYFFILNMFTTKVGSEFKWSSQWSSLFTDRATTVLNFPAQLKFLVAPGIVGNC